MLRGEPDDEQALQSSRKLLNEDDMVTLISYLERTSDPRSRAEQLANMFSSRLNEMAFQAISGISWI